MKLEGKRGKEAKENKVEERCNATKCRHYVDDEVGLKRLKDFVTIFVE
jgi:hypothetical protein